MFVAESATSSITKLTASGPSSIEVPAGMLDQPHGLALGNDGTLYIADTYHHRVLSLSPSGKVSSLANGFRYPAGVAVDVAGTVYVADTGHGTIQRINPGGVVSVVANPADAKASAESQAGQ